MSSVIAIPGTSSTHAKLSVIVPLYNEEDSVEPLHAAIVAAVAPLGIEFEMLFVDDGSRDTTHARAVAVARRDTRVRVIKFRRNYGQTAAMAAGIEYAAGEVLVTMDGDLQNDPADIEHLLAKINEGYDIVVGWRFRRQDKLVTRKIPSRVANWLIGKVTGVPIADNGCSLKAFRAHIIKSIPLYSEMHRFIPAMAGLAGPRIAQIRVRHHARRFGKSKYGLSRIYKVLMDLMVIKTIAAFSSRPLLWFSLLSLPLLLLGSAALIYGTWLALAPSGHVPWPVAGSGVILIASAVFLTAGGALGELVYGTGDSREYEFAQLTMQLRKRSPAS
jgi:glycosyltransferase involved in cell wall biosynthesis